MWIRIGGLLLDEAAVAAVEPVMAAGGDQALDFARVILHSGHVLEFPAPLVPALMHHFGRDAVALVPADEADELYLEYRRRGGLEARTAWDVLMADRRRIYDEARPPGRPTGMALARLNAIERDLKLRD